MATKQSPTKDDPKKKQAEIEAAQAELKAATDKHEAVVSALSRLGASAPDKRMAQAEKKKVDHALREAQRRLREAQGA